MKKLLVLAAVLFSLNTMAQQASGDMIKVNTERHDFGKIAQGTPVTTYFVITNTSDRPIAIESAMAGCGCTTPEYSREPIAPGASTKLKVGYNAAAIGSFNKDVKVKIAGATGEKVLFIGGEVVPADQISKTKTTPSVKKVTKAKSKK